MMTTATIPPKDTNDVIKYNDFEQRCRKAVVDYTKNTYSSEKLGGVFDKTQKEYDHILKPKKGEKDYLETIKELNLLPEVKTLEEKESLLDSFTLHGYAHHLNSSQIMCFNFFRPFIENNKPTKALFELLNQKLHIHIEENENKEIELQNFIP